VSRERAEAFCAWLFARAGVRVRLPTFAEREWAARAGTDATSAWCGDPAAFARMANLADASLSSVMTYDWGLPSGAIPPYRPAATNANDGHRVSAPAGSYEPNAWGLYDTAGNVWEWTSDTDAAGRAVAGGGSWYTHPVRALFDCRVAYPPWQRVFDVGFRVVMEDSPTSEL